MRIERITSALPMCRITNADLARLHPSWDMERVAEKTGVLSRAWCADNETALDLAERACRDLLTVDPRLPDVLLFCTQSPDHPMPPNACLLQARLGLPTSIAALDFTLACSGFVYGLYLASGLVDSGRASRVLLVTAETYSKWMNRDDRGPRTLFGDAAAATLVTNSDIGTVSFEMGTDGSAADTFCVPAGGTRLPKTTLTRIPVADGRGSTRTSEDLHMNGIAVLDFVKRRIPAAVRALLDRHGVAVGDIDLFVFHQASQLTLEMLEKTLRVPNSKIVNNLAHVGNAVSASIPIALEEAERAGRLQRGMKVLLMGFGVGMSWGGCVLTW